MRVPRAVARFNKRVTNPIQGVYAPYLAPWAVVHHVGRRSGITYKTPVLAFRSDEILAVVLFYGEGDWVKNALAAGSVTITRRGRDLTWCDLQVVSPTVPGLPRAAQVIGRSAGAVLVGRLVG